MELGFKSNGKARVAILVVFMFVFGLLGMAHPGTVVAKTEFSDPATKLAVVLNNNGVVTELATYTIGELQNMPQVEREYSSIDRMPAPVFTAGQGLDLEDFLTSLNIDINSITHFKFYATDDLVKNLDKDMLLGRTSYYYPRIVECWDDYWDGDNNRYTDVQKAMEGATPVKPMLAIASSQGRFLPGPDWSNLDGSTCLRLCLGQASPEECITMNFVRWVYKIEVFGKLQAGTSAVTSELILTAPASGESYQAGDKVRIAGTVQNLTAVTLTITAPDGQTVYTVFDLDAKGGEFTDEFTLGKDAVPGDYTIYISGSGLGRDCTQTFRVTKPASDIMLSTPQSGHTFQSGDKVTISGTANNLPSATLKVIGPGEQTIFTSTIDKSGDFTKDFTLAKDALPGDYTIKISGSGLDKDYTCTFKVVKADSTSTTPAKSVPETKPEPVAQPAVTVPVGSLNDIANHWAFDKINSLVTLGAIKGYPDGTFQPDAAITRAEFTTVVVKAFNLSNPNGKAFTDTTGHWAKDYIATAAAEGIVGGYNDSTFGPDDPITREQMAAMVVKAARLSPAAGENHFIDSSSIADWARDTVATAVNNQVIKGYPDNTFKPNGKATRAEAVTVIVNALKLPK